MLIKLIKRIIRTITVLFRINWINAFKFYDKDAEVVLWIFKPKVSYIGSDAFVKDMGILFGLIHEQKKFKLHLGFKIGRLHNKKIFLTLEDYYNVFGFNNYVDVLSHIISQLEIQGNQVFPSLKEALFWENKAFMHEQFKKLEVSEPYTQLFYSYADVLNANLKYPYLIKAEHSCSSNGLFKINSKEELDNLLISTDFLKENQTIIVQELINMKKDIRVILVKDEIVLHYWRVNTKEEWQPTSTSYGSSVDFVFFPDNWRSHIMETFKKLNITTGAFDITWQNDDLTTEPLYLEISPVFQPNPVINSTEKSYSYYKKGITFFPSWDAKFVDIVFLIKHKEVKASLSLSKA